MRRRTMENGAVAWQVRWRENGRQLSKTFSTQTEADDFARHVGVTIEVHSFIKESMIAPGKLADLIPEYVELIRTKNKPGSAHADQVHGCLLRGAARMDVKLTSEIDSRALDRLVRAYGDHKSMIRKSICIIKSFLHWVRRSRFLIDEYVFDYKSPTHVPKERLAWTEDEERKLLAECDAPNAAETLPSGEGTGRGSPVIVARMLATRDFLTRRAVRPALWLMLRYGPRPIETAKLTVGNWDPIGRTLTFPAQITKNGHARSFMVDTETADQLTAAAGNRAPSEPLFRTYRHHAWTSQHLTGLVNVLIKRAKLPGSAYCTRHTACTRLVRLAGGDLSFVKSISGHRTLAELSRYCHATGERRSMIANAFDSASNTR